MQRRDDGAGRVDCAEMGFGQGRAPGGERGKQFLHQRLDSGGVEVAGDDKEHALGTVPGVIEFNEAFARRGSDDILEADRQTLRKPCVGHEELKFSEEGAQAD